MISSSRPTGKTKMESSSSGVRTMPAGVSCGRPAEPLDPAAVLVEGDGRIAGTQRAEVVGRLDDALERSHHLPADTTACHAGSTPTPSTYPVRHATPRCISCRCTTDA